MAPRPTDTYCDGSEPGPKSEPDSDSDIDSGYGSLEEDPDERAGFYNDLLGRFREGGPTLANHGDNTKNMTRKQELKWIQ